MHGQADPRSPGRHRPLVLEDSSRRMRRLRVCIYGGTDLQGMRLDFVSALAYEILDSREAIIVTGGFRYSNEEATGVSTDVAALMGARRYADDNPGIDLKDCFEACIPEPDLDDRRDAEGVVRMTAADGITVRPMTGRTPLGRRLAMVAGVDLLVTISGKRHTEVVIEQALELGLPVLPIPFAGGYSERLLKSHRARIAAGFDPGALEKCLDGVSGAIDGHPERAAKAVVALLQTAKVGRCLVLLPYDPEHLALYESTIRPAVERHMFSDRLDRRPKSEPIYTGFADSVRSAMAVIADITLLNENVMYEVGYAHGRGLTPLIYTRDAARLDHLPVYFRTLNVRVASAATPLGILIDEYLRDAKEARRLSRLPPRVKAP
jgi:hypothetical protein